MSCAWVNMEVVGCLSCGQDRIVSLSVREDIAEALHEAGWTVPADVVFDEDTEDLYAVCPNCTTNNTTSAKTSLPTSAPKDLACP